MGWGRMGEILGRGEVWRGQTRDGAELWNPGSWWPPDSEVGGGLGVIPSQVGWWAAVPLNVYLWSDPMRTADCASFKDKTWGPGGGGREQAKVPQNHTRLAIQLFKRHIHTCLSGFTLTLVHFRVSTKQTAPPGPHAWMLELNCPQGDIWVWFKSPPHPVVSALQSDGTHFPESHLSKNLII